MFQTLRLLVAFLSFSAAFGHLTKAATPATEKRNVLFLVVDDLNTAIGAYGDPLAKTPNLDRLAARGVRFNRAYCQYPLCNPSRASFLSGRRPEVTGIYVLNTAARAALPDAVMLPQHFRQNGYFTAGAGKVHHSARLREPEAWDLYQDGAGEDEQEQAAIKARYGGGDGRPAWAELDGDGRATRDGLNASQVLSWIARAQTESRPFFLAAGFHKPHLPWTAPKKFFALHRESDFRRPSEPEMVNIPPIALQTELSGFNQPTSVEGARRAYYACVSFIDEQIGRLLDELDKRELWRNTVVVLFSDHGFHLGDHGGLWAKLSAFDVANRVPLLIAGAGVPEGRVVDAPVELIDVFPTLVALAGLSQPGGLDGRSLVETWSGGDRTADRMAYSMVFHYDQARSTDVLGRTVFAPSWRYTTWDAGKAGVEFYATDRDPAEFRNLVGEVQMKANIGRAEAALQALPAPKAGPANRPRALLPVAGKKN